MRAIARFESIFASVDEKAEMSSALRKTPRNYAAPHDALRRDLARRMAGVGWAAYHRELRVHDLAVGDGDDVERQHRRRHRSPPEERVVVLGGEGDGGAAHVGARAPAGGAAVDAGFDALDLRNEPPAAAEPVAEEDEGECEAEQPKHRRVEGVEEALERVEVLSRANCMHSDAASQGGGWWQGCGAAYPRDPDEAQQPQEAKQ